MPTVSRIKTKKDGTIYDIDSVTTNGHTVNSDVPSGAKFTDTVYDDSSLASRVSALEEKIKSLESSAS